MHEVLSIGILWAVLSGYPGGCFRSYQTFIHTNQKDLCGKPQREPRFVWSLLADDNNHLPLEFNWKSIQVFLQLGQKWRVSFQTRACSLRSNCRIFIWLWSAHYFVLCYEIFGLLSSHPPRSTQFVKKRSSALMVTPWAVSFLSSFCVLFQ